MAGHPASRWATIILSADSTLDMPADMIRELDLRKPIYRQLAAYGHMGREDLGVAWERRDKVDVLLAALEKLQG